MQKFNKTIIGILIGIVATAGIGAAVWQYKEASKTISLKDDIVEAPDSVNPAKEADKKSDDAAKKENAGASQFFGTINDLLAKKAAVKCDASYSVEGLPQKQTLYSDGTNFRMEAVVNIGGEDNNIHIIVKDGWEYMWTDRPIGTSPVAAGMKIKYTDLKTEDKTDLPGSDQGVDLKQAMDFSCQPWIVDRSMFEAPSNIEFNDLTDMTKNIMDNAPGNACDACSMMPSEVKAICEKQNCGSGN